MSESVFPAQPGPGEEVVPTPPDAGPAPVIEGVVGDVRGYGAIRSVSVTPPAPRAVDEVAS